MQLDFVVKDSYAEVGPDFLHQMTRVTLIMGLVLLGITVKKEQQMAQCVLKEHWGLTMVQNLATTVYHALEGSTASNLGRFLQLIYVARVTIAQQKQTFVIQIQATSSVQSAIFAPLVRPIR